MCLNRLDEFKISKYQGWQVFQVPPSGGGAKLYPLYYFRADHPDGIPTNEWMVDPRAERSILTDGSTCVLYKSGYHIYLRKRDAEKYLARCDNTTIRKVRFRKVVAKGRQGHQGGAKVVVAGERFIEK